MPTRRSAPESFPLSLEPQPVAAASGRDLQGLADKLGGEAIPQLGQDRHYLAQLRLRSQWFDGANAGPILKLGLQPNFWHLITAVSPNKAH